MQKISEERKAKRDSMRPLGYVLRYFTRLNRGNVMAAVMANKNITKIWKGLLKENASREAKRTIKELTEEFIIKLGMIYPERIEGLRRYLAEVRKTEKRAVCYARHQPLKLVPVLQDHTVLKQQKVSGFLKPVAAANTVSFKLLELPKAGDSKEALIEQGLYRDFLKAQNIVMLTHALTLPKKEYRLLVSPPNYRVASQL